MKSIVIIGGGSFICNLINYIESMNTYKIIGYTDITNNGTILDIPYLGDDTVLESIFNNGVRYASISIGNKLNDTSLKQKVVASAKKIGFIFPIIKGRNIIIHREVQIGEGTIIRDGAIIQSNCKLGRFVMIGDNSIITHDTIIGDFSQIVSGCVIGSGNILGKSVFMGYASVLINKLNVVDGCVIGANSFVNKDCSVKGLYFGQPAKLIKEYE